MHILDFGVNCPLKMATCYRPTLWLLAVERRRLSSSALLHFSKRLLLEESSHENHEKPGIFLIRLIKSEVKMVA